MPANVGKLDAALRWLLAAGLFAVALATSGSRLWALLAALAAVILAGTAATRVCPLWALLHINTCRNPTEPRPTPEAERPRDPPKGTTSAT